MHMSARLLVAHLLITTQRATSLTHSLTHSPTHSLTLTHLGGRLAVDQLASVCRAEGQGATIDAVALPALGRRGADEEGAIAEKIAQMASAATAAHLGASDGGEERVDFYNLHRGQRCREGGPAGARFELGFATEERRGAAGTAEGASAGLLVERRGVRLFGAARSQDVVLLAREDVRPLALGALDGVSLRARRSAGGRRGSREEAAGRGEAACRHGAAGQHRSVRPCQGRCDAQVGEQQQHYPARPARRLGNPSDQTMASSGPMTPSEEASQALIDAVGGDEQQLASLMNLVNVVSENTVTGISTAHVAAQTDNIDVLEQALRNGHTGAAANSNGTTPLMEAAYRGSLRVLERLLRCPAVQQQLDARDLDQETALMAAAQRGHTQAVMLLLQAGADVHARRRVGRADNSLELAEEGGHVETARILKEHTSDALESLNLSRCCATCGSRTALKVCAGDGCRAKYCSTACQREGWKRRGHKRSCGNALPTKDSIACAAPGSLVASLEEFGPASSKLTLACLDRIDTFASDDSGPLARLQEAADCVASLCACLTAHTADALVQEKARLATPIHTFQKNRPPQHSTPFPFQLQGLFALTKIRMVVRVGTSNLARLEAGHLVSE